MITWSGFGFLVPVIGFGSFYLTEGITKSLFNDESYYQTHGWPKLVAYLLNRKLGRAVIDVATGRKLILKRKHSLFFIPTQYWSYVLLVLGVILFFIKDT